MNGLKSRVLQDLSHVVPSKSIQLPASRLHVSSSNRRFWSFFEFSSKKEPCHDSPSIPPSSDIVSSSVVTRHQFRDVSTRETTLPENVPPTVRSSKPRSYPSNFEPTAMIRCALKIPRPFAQQDDLTSLLDGNPVPKTLKWKLKGYKTLRREEAGDFAFVPGGNSCELDVLRRVDCAEWLATTNALVTPAKSRTAKGQTGGTTPLTEHRAKMQPPAVEAWTDSKFDDARFAGAETSIRHRAEGRSEDASLIELPLSMQEVRSKTEDPSCAKKLGEKSTIVPSEETVEVRAKRNEGVRSTGSKLEDASLMELTRMKQGIESKMEDPSCDTKLEEKSATVLSEHKVKFKERLESALEKIEDTKSASVIKPRSSMVEATHSARATHQSSTHLPSGVPKPSPPSWKEYAPAQTSLPVQAKSRQEAKPSRTHLSSLRTSITPPKEFLLSAPMEWSSMEKGCKDVSSLIKPKPRNIERRKLFTQNLQNSKPPSEPPKSQSPMYFAPPPPKRPATFSLKRSQSILSRQLEDPLPSALENRPCNAVPKNPSIQPQVSKTQVGPDMKLRKAVHLSHLKRVSPCAATLARSQQSQSQQRPRSNNFGPSSMSGGSGNGAKKPPFFSIPAARQSSSLNSSKATAKPSPRARARTTNSTLRISTNVANSAPRRSCKDNDESSEGRVICTKPREAKCRREETCGREKSCNRQRQPKKRPKKREPCKRYCCPALSQQFECTMGRKCPPKPEKKRRECRNDDRGRERERSCSRTRERRDPSCLPEEPEKTSRRGSQSSCRRNRECKSEGKGREICTDPTRSRKSCDRQRRSCKRSERGERNCNRESQGCRRNRNAGSCRESERACPQGDRGGREICTRPRKGGSCERRRNCSGRRDYSQLSATSRRLHHPPETARRTSSLPSFGLLPRQSPVGRRSYGSSVESECPEKKSPCKSSMDESSGGCKKGPAKCISNSVDSACKSEESRSSCGKEESRGRKSCESTCKETSQDYCGSKKGTSAKDGGKESGESAKERASRELKEMRECKNRAKGGKEKSKEKKTTAKPSACGESKEMQECKKRGTGEKGRSKGKESTSKPTGLERVISPCKRKQLEKDSGKGGSKCSPKKFDCVANLGLPLNYLAASESANMFSSRSFSTVWETRPENSSAGMSMDRPEKCWNSMSETDFDHEELVPLPLVIETQEEEPEDTVNSRSSWLSSWFV